MNRDVLETLYVLGLVAWFGWELHKRLNPVPQAVYVPGPPPLPHEHRAAQVMCKCESCAPPFLQDAPGEH
jgi:hypothetical protein